MDKKQQTMCQDHLPGATSLAPTKILFTMTMADLCNGGLDDHMMVDVPQDCPIRIDLQQVKDEFEAMGRLGARITEELQKLLGTKNFLDFMMLLRKELYGIEGSSEYDL